MKTLTLRISLDGSDPEIWRVVEVLNDITLYELHTVIQIAMGWEDCHLHQFEIAERRYGHPQPHDHVDEADEIDETQVRLKSVVTKVGQSFRYVYDMGDYWQHTVTLESITPPDDRRFYPNLVKGERACPPEDCGGVSGYYDMLDALKNPKHPEYETYQEWIGNFDPDRFDQRGINKKFHRFDQYISGWDRD